MTTQPSTVPAATAAAPATSRVASTQVPAGNNRIAIFWLQMLYLLGLGVLAWVNVAPGVDESLKFPARFGPVPTAVLWFGALGGVLISLTGTTEHRYNWDPAYWTWHVARPLVGAAVAIIAVLIIQAGILAIGVDPANPQSNAITKDLFYYLVAFIAGYREETFRGMVKRLGDVILTSDDRGAAPAIVAIDPDHGPAAGGSPVAITGGGLSGIESVLFGVNRAQQIHVVSDAEITAVAPPGSAGQKVAISVAKPKVSAAAIQAFTYD